MDSVLASILQCLGISSASTFHTKNVAAEDRAARDIVSALFQAEKNGKDLKVKLQDTVGTYGWTANLANAVLAHLIDALDKAAPMGQALKDAFDRSTNEAKDFAQEHPIFLTIVALGILALMVPWALEALGFAELGIVEGEYR